MAEATPEHPEFPKEESGLVPVSSDAQDHGDSIDPLIEIGRRLLLEIGENPAREGLLDTPKRWAKMMRELTSGYKDDPQKYLAVQFQEEYDQIIIMRDIPFFSLCEHHLASFFGTITIAYMPNGKVFGASKLVRLVDCFSHRLQIQERLGRQITKALMDTGVFAAAVLIRARHLCMECRGVARHGQVLETSDAQGKFRDDPLIKSEWLQLIKG